MLSDTAEWVLVAIEGVGMLGGLALSVVTYVIAKETRKVRELSRRLDTSDERSREQTQQIVREQLKDIRERLDRGEAAFEKLGDRDRSLESLVAGRIDALKDSIRENSSSKHDLAAVDGRIKNVADRLQAIGDTVAGLKATVHGVES